MSTVTTFTEKDAENNTKIFHRILREAFSDLVIKNSDGYINKDWSIVYNGVHFEKLVGRHRFGKESTFEGIKLHVSLRKRVYRRVMAKKINLDVNPTFSFSLVALKEKYEELLALVAPYEESQKKEATKEKDEQTRINALSAELGIHARDIEAIGTDHYRIEIMETADVLKEVMKLVNTIRSLREIDFNAGTDIHA